MASRRSVWKQAGGKTLATHAPHVRFMSFFVTRSECVMIGSLKLGNVWIFVQLFHMPMWTKNQLYKNPNIA